MTNELRVYRRMGCFLSLKYVLDSKSIFLEKIISAKLQYGGKVLSQALFCCALLQIHANIHGNPVMSL